MIKTLCFLAVIAYTLCQDLDEGYDILYKTFDEPIERTCFTLSQKTSFAKGTWVIPSVGQFEMGNNKFTSVLDGFGKLHKFDFVSDQVCFTSKMIESGFYNESMAKGKAAPGVLFMDMQPPMHYNYAQKMGGPNDNVYVKTLRVGETYFSLTDAQTMLEFSPADLSIVKKVEFSDAMDKGKIATGSAHAMKRGECMIGIDPQSDLGGANVNVIVYEMCPSNDKDKSKRNNGKFERKILNSYNFTYIPYCHSFGLSENYAILPHQGLYFDYNKVLKGGQPLVNATIDVSDQPLVVKVVPLNGVDEVITITMQLDKPFYYFHFINSFEIENGDAVVMDISMLDVNVLPYFTVDNFENKEYRDSSAQYQSILVNR